MRGTLKVHRFSIQAVGTSSAAVAESLGYGDGEQMFFEECVAGINLEDSAIQDGKRFLKAADDFAATIEYVKSRNKALFLNARCDTYLLDAGNTQEETIHRLRLYESAGADGIFLPFIIQEVDIADVVQHTRIPVNVMCMPAYRGLYVCGSWA